MQYQLWRLPAGVIASWTTETELSAGLSLWLLWEQILAQMSSSYLYCFPKPWFHRSMLGIQKKMVYRTHQIRMNSIVSLHLAC